MSVHLFFKRISLVFSAPRLKTISDKRFYSGGTGTYFRFNYTIPIWYARQPAPGDIMALKKTSGTEEPVGENNADAIEKFFRRPFFLSFTIGIPFCFFKLLFGVAAIRAGASTDLFLVVFGWLVIFWAAADLLMNIGRSILDIFHRPAPFEYCTIAQAGRIFNKPMVFLAIDTLLTFGIICAMLWSGWITTLTPLEQYLWYAATTLNLISLSLVSIYHELRKE
jgi:cation transport ATPase